MERQQILSGVIEALKENFDCNEVKEESHLIDDLGLDSLDCVELLMALETKLEISIPDEKESILIGRTTVKDWVDYIQFEIIGG